MILRSFLCLLVTAALMSAVVAAPQQGSTDVQSLQYEFGKNVKPQSAPVLQRPCDCGQLVVCVPIARPYCCAPYPVCYPCYTPCYAPCYTPRCYPTPIHRHTCVRPVYRSPYCCGCW